MVRLELPFEVRSNPQGCDWLARTAEELNSLQGETIVFVGTRLIWFDANLCSVFGALLYDATLRLNEIEFDSLRSSIIEIWSKNGFLKHYGGIKKSDTYLTTLAYQRFGLSDEVQFARYIRHELMLKEIPQMADGAKRQFEASIQEMFNNAVLHADSKKGAFSCGQHFPHKYRLDFTVTDLGVGFRANVERKTGKAWTPQASIQWATEERHTTREGSIPGGLGLKLLRAFIRQNEGRLQIVSENGFWEFHKGQEQSETLKGRFPGSFVNIQINTNDLTHYDGFDDGFEANTDTISIF